MGYVVTARELGLALLEKLSTLDNVDYLCPVSVSEFEIDTDEVRISTEGDAGTATLHCRLLVAADGSGSFVRNRLGLPARLKDYDQSAIVSNITVDADHRDTAYERFTLRGPVALLPMPGSRFVSVFCVPAGLQAGYMDMDPEEYIRALQEVLGNRAGRITAVGCRSAYPLRLIQANSQIAERTVLLGNAAHTVHPNGAQGFNLALRDVAALAELLRRCDIVQGDPGSQGLLRDYVACRSLDQEQVVNFTDSLTGLFYNDNLFKAIGRNLGMLVLDSVPLFKNKFARLAMGLEGRQPGLVRGLSLDQL
jgi:ubiquinone biosynthesis UbiH/UbiF/VisC/COQ6 family hydroxylase